jgi:hypothetical protein
VFPHGIRKRFIASDEETVKSIRRLFDRSSEGVGHFQQVDVTFALKKSGT